MFGAAYSCVVGIGAFTFATFQEIDFRRRMDLCSQWFCIDALWTANLATFI